MGLGGLEPPTSRLSGVRSNQLSYRPTPRIDAEEIEPVETERRPHSPPSPWIPRESEPGLTRVGRIEPGRHAGQARSQPRAPEREKNSART